MTDRVTIDHVRRAGFCVRGARRFADSHGFDFRKLLEEGIEVSEAEKIDDEMVRRVLAVRRRMEAESGEGL